MNIQIISTAEAKVTIDGKIVPYVDACICVDPNQDGTEIVSSITPFLNELLVISNVSNITTAIPNDPNIEPEVLEADANTAMINKILSLNYNYKPIN